MAIGDGHGDGGGRGEYLRLEDLVWKGVSVLAFAATIGGEARDERAVVWSHSKSSSRNHGSSTNLDPSNIIQTKNVLES